MKLFLTALLALYCGAASSAELGYKFFVSETYRFSVQYPSSWNVGPTIHTQTVIRVESPGGDDFNITVVPNASLRNMSPDQYVQEMLDGMGHLIAILSKNYPGARLIEKGTTKLSQQPAVYYVVDFTLSAAGVDIPWRSYSISTTYLDTQYTLTFRSPKQFFHEYIPVIEFIALSFQFTKTRIE